MCLLVEGGCRLMVGAHTQDWEVVDLRNFVQRLEEDWGLDYCIHRKVEGSWTEEEEEEEGHIR